MSDSEGTDPRAAQLGHIRHDLRTPINAILGYSEMLLEDAGEAGEFASLLREVNSLGRQLLESVNRLLHNDVLNQSTLDELADQARAQLAPMCREILTRCERLQQIVEPEFAGDLQNIHQASARFQALLAKWGVADPAAESPPPDSSRRRLPVVPQVLPTGPSSLVLVVDDNEFNRDLLARGLLRQGHRYDLAANGLEALTMLAKQDFDLVLLDIMMPEMDGFEVLARIKSDPQRKHIPVIMISALDQIDSVVRCIEMGAEDYLPKPFDPVLLRARVGASLEKKRFRDQELEYLRNVTAVTAAAAAMENNQFDPASLGTVAQRTDPLGQLARVFQSMAREVQARVDRLQQQVQQLTVEIDESRKAKQVAEITETDYFQELQQKAQTLRKRRT